MSGQNRQRESRVEWRIQKIGQMILVLCVAYGIGTLVGHLHTKSVAASAKPVEPKMIAITFDDGPNPEYTRKLLKEITGGTKETWCKSHVFCVGRRGGAISGYPGGNL